jgi:hypothetical protein
MAASQLKAMLAHAQTDVPLSSLALQRLAPTHHPGGRQGHVRGRIPVAVAPDDEDDEDDAEVEAEMQRFMTTYKAASSQHNAAHRTDDGDPDSEILTERSGHMSARPTSSRPASSRLTVAVRTDLALPRVGSNPRYADADELDDDVIDDADAISFRTFLADDHSHGGVDDDIDDMVPAPSDGGDYEEGEGPSTAQVLAAARRQYVYSPPIIMQVICVFMCLGLSHFYLVFCVVCACHVTGTWLTWCMTMTTRTGPLSMTRPKRCWHASTKPFPPPNQSLRLCHLPLWVVLAQSYL